MNELLYHSQFVLTHLNDKTAALALADRYQELRDMTRFEALRAVGQLRRGRRNAREMAAATHRLKAGVFGNVTILIMVIDAAELNDDRPVQIVVRPGSRPPVAFSCDWHGDDGHWAYWSITVGARWVLQAAAEFDKDAFAWDAQYQPDYGPAVE